LPWHLVATALPNLATALALGSLIGAERQWRHRTAGLKTNALVAVGASTFMIVAAWAGSADGTSRIAAQIVSGIGFLGAGVILREGLSVRGLNTAATLWCSAAVGTLAGASEPVLAVLATLAVLLVNLGLQPLVTAINRLPAYAFGIETQYAITLRCTPDHEPELRRVLLAAVRQPGFRLESIESTKLPQGAGVEIALTLRLPVRDDSRLDIAVAPLLQRRGVEAARWSVAETTE
jgi:putative Mg2+ transporter-C (MgtC) family protein